jgi:hypothetical protein
MMIDIVVEKLKEMRVISKGLLLLFPAIQIV